MKYKSSVNSFLANLIPAKLEVGQNLYFKFHVEVAVSLSIFDGF